MDKNRQLRFGKDHSFKINYSHKIFCRLMRYILCKRRTPSPFGRQKLRKQTKKKNIWSLNQPTGDYSFPVVREGTCHFGKNNKSLACLTSSPMENKCTEWTHGTLLQKHFAQQSMDRDRYFMILFKLFPHSQK